MRDFSQIKQLTLFPIQKLALYFSTLYFSTAPFVVNYAQICKKLGINPAIYHGGDLEGKTVQTMLNCARKPHKFELLECLEDKADEREKYVRALSTLTKVSDALKTHKRRWLASKFAPFLPKLAPFSG